MVAATSIIHKIKIILSPSNNWNQRKNNNENEQELSFFWIKIMISTCAINCSHISLLSVSQFCEEKYSLHTRIWAFPCTGWPKVYLAGEGVLVIMNEQNHHNILWTSSEIIYEISKLGPPQWSNSIRNSHLLVLPSPQNLG